MISYMIIDWKNFAFLFHLTKEHGKGLDGSIIIEYSTVTETNLCYFDIGTIDNIPRLPIDNYQNKSFVSLDKTLNSVEHLLQDIQTKVKTAKARI